MPEYRLVLMPDRDPSRQEYVVERLSTFNAAHCAAMGDDQRTAQPLDVILLDKHNNTVGGFFGSTRWGWLQIGTLWVSDTLRGSGQGTRLLAEAELEARKRGCSHVRLDTFSFQARGFYERLGYRVVGQMDDYPLGHTHYWMRKDLDAAGDANRATPMLETVTIRQATEDDAAELARLRFQFTEEECEAGPEALQDFFEVFSTFWRAAATSGRWIVWVGESEGRLVGNVWLQQIDRVPRPGRLSTPYGYVTNVYVEPGYRGRGIGSALIERTVRWARDRPLEFLVLWPSEQSGRFYERLGFARTTEAIELHLEVSGAGCSSPDSHKPAPSGWGVF